LLSPPSPSLSYDVLPTPSSSPPSTPESPGQTVQSFEEYINTLQRTLAHLQSEHETLLSDLKSAKRDSQKSQSALRAEISTLKKAVQKHAAGDVRMRQKARALEEATKQASRGRTDVDNERVALENEHTAREPKRVAQQSRWEAARGSADIERCKRERSEEAAAERVQNAKADLTALESRLDKLRIRREKLCGSAGGSDEEEGAPKIEGGIVGELSARLHELQRERKAIEDDPYGYITTSQASASYPVFNRDISAVNEPTAVARTARNHSHQRNHTHPHHSTNGAFSTSHHPRVGGSSNGGKRHPTFANHNPPQTHVAPHASFPPFTVIPPPPQRGLPPVQRPTTHQQPPNSYIPARSGGRPTAVRRKSSPSAASAAIAPGMAERSTLSSLAPPFEPASARGRAPPWGAL
jgi:hypothetical protein